MPNVTIYTDGSCLKNPGGNGGWAAIVKRDGKETRLSGGVARTTNNRMEITALLEALRSLDEPSAVLAVTDSQYVANSVSKGWLAGWARRGWVDKDGNARLNADLWKLLLHELERHRVTIRWIRGHAGHRENEICDRLARKAAEGPNLPLDEGYASTPAQGAPNGPSPNQADRATMPDVTIYTDGSCLKNPGGNGGWAAIVKRGGEETRLSGGVARTTNNRMEITALLEALRSLDEPSAVLVVTDSQYVANSVSKGWLAGWARRGWVDKDGNARLNADLWKLLLHELERHRVTIRWIRGQAGHRENEICDRLARKAAEGPNLPLDEGYASTPAQGAPNDPASGTKSFWRPVWQSRPKSSPKSSGKACGASPSDPGITATGARTKSPAATSAATATAAGSPATRKAGLAKDRLPRAELTRAGLTRDTPLPAKEERKGAKEAGAGPTAPPAPRKRPAGTRLVPGSLDAMLRSSED